MGVLDLVKEEMELNATEMQIGVTENMIKHYSTQDREEVQTNQAYLIKQTNNKTDTKM